MRPLQLVVWPVDANGDQIRFDPASDAKPLLEKAFGFYCCYCESFHHNLQVEHLVSQDQDPNREGCWYNFLLACSRCNGKDNKSNHSVDFLAFHFPHKDNTLISFCYFEGGKVTVNPGLEATEQEKARKLMKLVGLDKYPGNPEYVSISPKDQRWNVRQTQWEFAQRKVVEFEKGGISTNSVVEFALQRGHFSIWFTLFANHPDVREALIEAFKGTAKDCFDPTNGFNPIPRPRNQT
jgi:hypothetical protein